MDALAVALAAVLLFASGVAVAVTLYRMGKEVSRQVRECFRLEAENAVAVDRMARK